MVLAADVIGPGGTVLVTSGSALSDRHIQLLKTRDITEIDIQEPTAIASDKEISPKTLEIMTQRFRENDDNHPFIKELKNIWLNQVNKQ